MTMLPLCATLLTTRPEMDPQPVFIAHRLTLVARTERPPYRVLWWAIGYVSGAVVMSVVDWWFK